MYLPEGSSARIVALAAVLRMLERKRCGEPKVAQMPYRHPYAGEVSNSHFSNSHILVRAKVVRSVPERPANYSHVLARRLTKPFPFRQQANYLHGFAKQLSNIFILRQNCSRIALVRFRLERLQKLTFYNQTNVSDSPYKYEGCLQGAIQIFYSN